MNLGLKYKERRKNIEENLKLKLLREDSILLHNCIEYAQDEVKYASGIPVLYKNIKLIKNYVNLLEIISENIDGLNYEDRLEKLDKYLSKIKLAILLPIRLKDLSDVFSVFSSMNSKGLPLTIIDLLKADYLRVANKQNMDDEEALDLWKEFENSLTMENSEMDLSDAKRFIQNNYDAFHQRGHTSLTVKDSLSKYQELFNRSSNIKTIIEKLIKNAHIYALIESKDYSKVDYFKNYNNDNKLYYEAFENELLVSQLKILQKLDISSAYPLIMYLLDELSNDNITKDDCIKVFEYIIVVFIRRNVTKKPKSSNMRNMLLGVLRNVQSQEKLMKILLLMIFIKA